MCVQVPTQSLTYSPPLSPLDNINVLNSVHVEIAGGHSGPTAGELTGQLGTESSDDWERAHELVPEPGWAQCCGLRGETHRGWNSQGSLGGKGLSLSLEGPASSDHEELGESNFRSHPPFLKLWCFAQGPFHIRLLPLSIQALITQGTYPFPFYIFKRKKMGRQGDGKTFIWNKLVLL